jgi:hypothetical protein
MFQTTNQSFSHYFPMTNLSRTHQQRLQVLLLEVCIWSSHDHVGFFPGGYIWLCLRRKNEAKKLITVSMNVLNARMTQKTSNLG